MALNLRKWQCWRYLAGACLLGVIGSCTSNDEPESLDNDREIAYSVSTEWFNSPSETRGALLNALSSGSMWITSKITGTSTTYFEKEVLSFGSGAWNTANKYLWPDVSTGQTLDFYAIYPSGDTNWTASSGNTWTYATPQANASQKDVMYATSMAQKKNSNSGIVPLNMKHALSAVSFSAKTQSSSMAVTVSGVDICNVNTTGTFNFPTTSTTSTSDPYVNRWTNVGTKGTLSAGITTTTLNNTSSQLLTATDGAVLMLPQTLTKWNLADGNANASTQTGSFLKISCRILSNSSPVVGDASTDGEVYVPFEGTFEAGKHYQIDMTFGFGYKENGQSYGLVVYLYSSITPWTTVIDKPAKPIYPN